ncbi:MAG: pilus assembly protein CpaE, partial [Brevundimonas sp.]
MTSAAPRAFDDFDDDLELDMAFADPARAQPFPSGDINPREPLQFTAPAGAPAGRAQGVPSANGMAASEGFNPAGALIAGAQTALNQAPIAAAGPGYSLTPAGNIGEVSVPRIAIHVFAERQDTLAAAERAGQDRRLARATTQIRIGGVAAAVEAYRHEPTPPLIVVESQATPQALLHEVDMLAEVCDVGTKVIVVGPTNDIILFRELMRRGVSEYLVAPLQPLQLISAIGGLFNDPAQPFVGRSIAFVGARGGAGAS